MKKKSTAKKAGIIRHTAAEAAKRKGETDWERVNKLTDKEIDAAIASDPDAAPDIETLDWTKAVMVIPYNKKAVSLRLDDDVLTFFRQSGKGYQTRINAVLRRFMEASVRTNRQ